MTELIFAPLAVWLIVTPGTVWYWIFLLSPIWLLGLVVYNYLRWKWEEDKGRDDRFERKVTPGFFR